MIIAPERLGAASDKPTPPAAPAKPPVAMPATPSPAADDQPSGDPDVTE
jgi:hypothetical protein